MSNPEISVVMSVYEETKELLIPAIESILGQTYNNLEFLVIVDNPDYKYKNILDQFCEDDQRVKLICNRTNIGLTKSLNNAVKIARGKYVARQDADDISLPQRLECQYKFLKENPMYSIVGTNIRFVDSDGKLIRKISWHKSRGRIDKTMLFKKNRLVHGTVLMNKDDLISVGNYNGNLRYGQDYELWLRFLRNNKKIFILNSHLYYLRQHQKSVTVKSAFHQSMMHFLIQKEIDFNKFNSDDIDQYLSILSEKQKSYVCYMTSKIILRSNVVESLDYCKNSIKYYKCSINTYLLFGYILLNMLFRKI
ncbi:MAG: glycosyltransferase [Candidatus Brocadiaceae bacterium]|nr:glycosyltransferase [Candidatus Brocadiaceae bacterium]